MSSGGSEVEYYDRLGDGRSWVWKRVCEGMEGGGLIDELRKKLCMLGWGLEM